MAPSKRNNDRTMNKTIAILTIITAVLGQEDIMNIIDDQKVMSITGVSGSSAILPCPLNPRTEGDHAKLILWYKKGVKTPLLSYDVRNQESTYKNMPYKSDAKLGLSSISAKLKLTDLTLDKAGIYECRVDYHNSPIHTNQVNLTVIVPPYSVEIFDKKKEFYRDGIAGPYEEGATIILTCLAKGGVPRPNITWWSGQEVLHSTSPQFEAESPNMVESELFLQEVGRKWLGKMVTCLAHNSNFSSPVISTVKIDLFLFPTKVILQYTPPSMDGSIARIVCKAVGSKPQAEIEWLIDDIDVPTDNHVSTITEAMTTSVISVNVTKGDNGKEVVCKATNPSIRDSFLRNSTFLDVHYPPSAKAILGPSLRPSLLKEDDDVYFVCDVDSNPVVKTVKWFHQNKLLKENKKNGVIFSGNSLVLQRVNRNRAGKYYCTASNSLGHARSPSVNLKLRYKPECNSSSATYFIYDHPINVSCTVSSHPIALQLRWKWNGGNDILNVRPLGSELERTTVPIRLSNYRASGMLTVNPSHSFEDRDLSCWGVNQMGTQSVPCIFSIKVAKIPEPLASCRLANITTSSLSLSCQQSDISLADSTIYRAELYLGNSTLFANVSSNEPHFRISRLDPGTSYQIKVYVSLGPATSLPVVVSASTFRMSRVEASTSGSFRAGISIYICAIFYTFPFYKFR